MNHIRAVLVAIGVDFKGEVEVWLAPREAMSFLNIDDADLRRRVFGKLRQKLDRSKVNRRGKIDLVEQTAWRSIALGANVVAKTKTWEAVDQDPDLATLEARKSSVKAEKLERMSAR